MQPSTSDLPLPPNAVALLSNAERLNRLAGRHWQRFAKQNYFDEHGVFAGALLGAPLLLIMFVILVRKPITTPS